MVLSFPSDFGAGAINSIAPIVPLAPQPRARNIPDSCLIDPNVDAIRVAAIQHMNRHGWAYDLAISHKRASDEPSLSVNELILVYHQARALLFGEDYFQRRWVPKYGPDFAQLVLTFRSHCSAATYQPDFDTWYTELSTLAKEIGRSKSVVTRLLANHPPSSERYGTRVTRAWPAIRQFVVKCRRRRWDPIGTRFVLTANLYLVALETQCLAEDVEILREAVHQLLTRDQRSLTLEIPAIVAADPGSTSTHSSALPFQHSSHMAVVSSLSTADSNSVDQRSARNADVPRADIHKSSTAFCGSAEGLTSQSSVTAFSASDSLLTATSVQSVRPSHCMVKMTHHSAGQSDYFDYAGNPRVYSSLSDQQPLPSAYARGWNSIDSNIARIHREFQSARPGRHYSALSRVLRSRRPAPAAATLPESSPVTQRVTLLDVTLPDNYNPATYHGELPAAAERSRPPRFQARQNNGIPAKSLPLTHHSHTE